MLNRSELTQLGPPTIWESFERELARCAQEQRLTIGPREHAKRDEDLRQLVAIVVRLVHTRFIAGLLAQCVDGRHQCAPRQRAPCPAPADGERESIGRFRRSELLPPPAHERRQRVLRDVFRDSMTAGSGEDIPDQPGRECGHDGLEIHNVNEPGVRVS